MAYTGVQNAWKGLLEKMSKLTTKNPSNQPTGLAGALKDIYSDYSVTALGSKYCADLATNSSLPPRMLSVVEIALINSQVKFMFPVKLMWDDAEKNLHVEMATNLTTPLVHLAKPNDYQLSNEEVYLVWLRRELTSLAAQAIERSFSYQDKPFEAPTYAAIPYWRYEYSAPMTATEVNLRYAELEKMLKKLP